jgi:hypothetical protein
LVTTPGPIVNVTPEFTVTLVERIYGLPEVAQVVLLVIFPDTTVIEHSFAAKQMVIRESAVEICLLNIFNLSVKFLGIIKNNCT